MSGQIHHMDSARDPVLDAFLRIRQATPALCRGLETEDYGLQAMPETSPPKWHLAHTSWFFETFILKPLKPGYRVFDPAFEYLFNSYYNGIGAQYPRAQRGLLSRPSLPEVLDYRSHIDHAMSDFLQQPDSPSRETVLQRVELGLQHEQQHQELLCTDIKYGFSKNPLYPRFADAPAAGQHAPVRPMNFRSFDEGEARVGHTGNGFHFDNEVPEHCVHVAAFSLADRLVNNAEFLEFVEDGGYRLPGLWLADGWVWLQDAGATAPLYWQRRDDAWFEYTLYGLQPLDEAAPVCHVNYYEADAFARWSGRRLPSEQEWETACRRLDVSPATGEDRFHPCPAGDDGGLQFFADAWQWTASAYAAYPGFRPPPGAIGEYNGKFMCNQMVLRGSSCVSPPGHARASYRNFFYPKDQWQFSGIRLADDRR